MPAESVIQFEALEAQAAALMEIFKGAGYERVAPSMIQPADVFLDRMGETIRGRTYVFSDLDGVELCLRPDLTVPTCRLYLERDPEAGAPARYAYNGPAFRYQPGGQTVAQPREFRQAGIENIGAEDAAAAEAEVVALAVEAVRSAGLETFTLRLGDLGLFDALIEALDMAERWRARLRHQFWRPAAFHELLHQLAAGAGGSEVGPVAALAGALEADDPAGAEEQLAAFLDSEDIAVIGTRTLTEITDRLLERAADAREAPLPEAAVKLIEDYLAVSGPPKAATARIADLMASAEVDLEAALETFRARLDAFAARDIDLNACEFGAEFGRNLEYYTGLVFQIEVPDMGRAGQVAGGGRYDGLLSDLGAPEPVPAVGCAIHTERLLAAVTGVSA